MGIKLSNQPTKAEIEKALNTLKKRATGIEKKTLEKHFGVLKRGIDGLEFQKQIRNDWA